MSATRSDILKRIRECEINGTFDVHVDPIDYELTLPVDETFPYIHKPLHLRIGYFLDDLFVVRPFARKLHKKDLHTKVVGRENLSGIERAIVTCNHVNMWDCLVVMKAMQGHKLYITAGWFNNRKDKLGTHMRAERMMPLSRDPKGMKHFIAAVDELLQGNHYVLFYPEEAMWWNYEKPRPYKDGAFHFAAKNQVPVIPTFITFTPNGEKDAEGIEKKDFTIHILPAIYPQEGLSRKENTAYLKNANYEACKACYENFYHKKLTYASEE